MKRWRRSLEDRHHRIRHRLGDDDRHQPAVADPDRSPPRTAIPDTRAYRRGNADGDPHDDTWKERDAIDPILHADRHPDKRIKFYGYQNVVSITHTAPVFYSDAHPYGYLASNLNRGCDCDVHPDPDDGADRDATSDGDAV